MARSSRTGRGVPSPPISDRIGRSPRGWPKSGSCPLGAARSRVVRAIRWLGIAEPARWGTAIPGPPTFDEMVVGWLTADEEPPAP